MKKILTITLAIALSWAPSLAVDDLDNPELLESLFTTAHWRMAADEADAKAEIAQINDLATLEKMANDSYPSPEQRFAMERLNELKKSSVVTNEVEQASLETPPVQPERPASNKPFLWIFVIALLAIIGGVVAWKKKR